MKSLMARMGSQDVLGGVGLVGVGTLFLIGALDYRIGTAQQMGPGYFPMVLGGILVVLGAAIAALGLRRPVPVTSSPLRPLGAVMAAIATFGFAVHFFGLVPAIIGTVAVSALGDRSSTFLSTVALAICLAGGLWLLFSYALGLPLRAFKVPL